MAGASFRTRMVIKNTPENVRAPMQDIASNAIKGLRDVFTSHMRDLTVSARENAPSGEKWIEQDVTLPSGRVISHGRPSLRLHGIILRDSFWNEIYPQDSISNDGIVKSSFSGRVWSRAPQYAFITSVINRRWPITPNPPRTKLMWNRIQHWGLRFSTMTVKGPIRPTNTWLKTAIKKPREGYVSEIRGIMARVGRTIYESEDTSDDS